MKLTNMEMDKKPFHLSQIGGHNHVNNGRSANSKKQASSSGKRLGDWQLTPKQEACRSKALGPVSTPSFASNVYFPAMVRRQLVRARGGSYLHHSKAEPRRQDGIGMSRRVLLQLEKQHGQENQNGAVLPSRLGRRRRRDKDGLNTLFPLAHDINDLDANELIMPGWDDDALETNANGRESQRSKDVSNFGQQQQKGTACLPRQEPKEPHTRTMPESDRNENMARNQTFRGVPPPAAGNLTINKDTDTTRQQQGFAELKLPTPPPSSSEEEDDEEEEESGNEAIEKAPQALVDLPQTISVPSIVPPHETEETEAPLVLQLPPQESSSDESDSEQDDENDDDEGETGRSNLKEAAPTEQPRQETHMANMAKECLSDPEAKPENKSLGPPKCPTMPDPLQLPNSEGNLEQKTSSSSIPPSSPIPNSKSSVRDHSSPQFSYEDTPSPIKPSQLQPTLNRVTTDTHSAKMKQPAFPELPPNKTVADISMIDKNDAESCGVGTPKKAAHNRSIATEDTDSPVLVRRANHGNNSLSFDLMNTPSPIRTSTPGSTPSIKYRQRRRNVFLTQADGFSPHGTPHRESFCSLRDTPESKLSQSAFHDTPSTAPQIPCDSAETVDDLVCSVCLNGDSPDCDPIVLCDGVDEENPTCNVAVHVSCYSIVAPLGETWRCDVCEWKRSGQKQQPQCAHCLRDDHPAPLKKQSDGTFVHPFCLSWSETGSDVALCSLCGKGGALVCAALRSCRFAVHPKCAKYQANSDLIVIDQNQKRSMLFCRCHRDERYTKLHRVKTTAPPSPSPPASPFCVILPSGRFERIETNGFKRASDVETTPEAKRPRNRLRKLGDQDNNKSPENSNAEVENRKKRNREVMEAKYGQSKFIETEALIDSDEDSEGDEVEGEIRRIEEEEELHGSFINDTSQLGYSQDDLDRIDPDTSFGSPSCHTQSLHRRVDAMANKQNQFSTPIFNRRMIRKSDDGSAYDDAWGEHTPRDSSSQKGLGNMHFIRSVIEHHKKGGRAEEIEELYHQVGRELEDESQSPPQRAITRKPMEFEYIPSDEEEEEAKVKEAAPKSSPATPVKLTQEQREMIEAKRLQALERRKQAMARKAAANNQNRT